MKTRLARLTAAFLSFAFAAPADEIFYDTSFEPPTFSPDLPLAGQNRWEVDMGHEAITLSTNNPRTGTRSVRMDGAWLDPQASGYSMANARIRASELPASAPRVIVEVTASVRLDGPPIGIPGASGHPNMGANLVVYALTPGGIGDLLGGLQVSSAGRIVNVSRVAADNEKFSVPYTLGTWRTITVRVDFLARRLTWIVDGVELGSGPFADFITSDQLFSGTLLLSGTTDPQSTPEYDYDPANYTAYFDDYRLKSISLEGPALLVEQPADARLVSGASTVDFGNSLVGTPSPRVFTLRNAGNAAINGVSVTLEGANAGEFALTAPPAGTVAPGESAPFTVTFTPSASGARTATLRIASNDPDDNPFTLALTGRGRSPAEILQQAYLKASNTGVGDWFGSSVAVSGNTMVIGAGGEDSNATGINGNQNNNSAFDAGAAYVFVRDGTNWTQQAWLKASNPAAEDSFGLYSVAISGDTIVVGAAGEDSNATGVNGDQSNNSAGYAGAAYVFVREGTNWTQQAYLKASNAGANDWFGAMVAISSDTIVVSAPAESSSATGVNGNQNNNSAREAGAAYVFVREGTNWVQQAYLKASNAGVDDWFGSSVAISGDTVVVGAWWEDSNAQGVNGNQNNNTSMDAGAAYVFAREGTNWTQQAYLKASNTPASNTSGPDAEEFGLAVAISEDTIVVGAPREDSNALGVNGNQTNNSAGQSGAAYVFNVAGSTAHEQWRALYFGSTANTGSGADTADPDFDGLDNRLEFACGTHPLLPGAALMSGAQTATGIEFTYSRRKAALTELQFAVEWSDTLAPGSWSTAGVSEVILSDDGTVQQVKATSPLGSGSRRFVRLRVTN
jgi:FG-GAP repeat/Abnormal spindle-like microcephaly-assoc'd, ASPM-SPD-2-Hydin